VGREQGRWGFARVILLYVSLGRISGGRDEILVVRVFAQRGELMGRVLFLGRSGRESEELDVVIVWHGNGMAQWDGYGRY
jgi:hypothetical protein